MKAPTLIDNLWRLLFLDAFRDRLSRFIQYTLLMLIPFIVSMGYSDLGASMSIVRSNMSFIRMAMRFGKPSNLVNTINRRHASGTLDIIDMLRSISDGVNILYYLTDHPLFLYKLGLLPMSLPMNDQIDYWNNIFWLGTTLIELFITTITARRMNLSSKLYDFTLTASDLPIIFFFMNWWPEIFGPEFAGACGSLCSLAGLYNMW